MVPGIDRPDSDDSDQTPSPPRDLGGASSALNEEMLYRVVRKAVKDALLDVIGTVLLVGVAFVLAVAGSQAMIWSTSILETVISSILLLVGLYIAAATLELIPPIRRWV